MFSPTSGASQQPTLIPAGTLAFAVVKVRELKKSQSTGGEYADLELTIDGGDFNNRKVFEMVCNPMDEKNSEGWRKMGIGNLTRMFEAAGIFKVEDPSSYEKLNGRKFLTICQYLDGARIAIKVKVEKDKDGAHPDRNKVGEYLSPNPNSGSNANYKKLLDGGAGAVSAARSTAFGSAPAAPVAGTSAPSWLNQPK